MGLFRLPLPIQVMRDGTGPSYGPFSHACFTRHTQPSRSIRSRASTKLCPVNLDVVAQVVRDRNTLWLFMPFTDLPDTALFNSPRSIKGFGRTFSPQNCPSEGTAHSSYGYSRLPAIF